MRPIIALGVLLSACVPTTSPQPSNVQQSPALPFKGGQTWEVVGQSKGSNAEERFTFTVQAPKPSGSRISLDAERQIISVNNIRFIPLGVLYSQTEASLIATLAVADTISAGPENTEVRNCMVEAIKQPIGNTFSGLYYAGKMKEFVELGKAKDYSKFGTCTLLLK